MIDYFHIEQELIGCVMYHKDTAERDEAIATVEHSAFQNFNHQQIWKAIGEVAENGGVLDVVSIGEKCSGDIFVWVVEIMQKYEGVKSGLSMYVERVKKAGYHHQLMKTLRETIEYAGKFTDVYNMPDLEEYVSNSLKKNTLDTTSKEARKFKEVSKDLVEEMQARINKDPSMQTLSTGIDALDNITGGIDKTDLIVVAGTSGGGKTELIMNIASKISTDQGESLVFSMEMSDKQVVARSIANEAMISNSKIRVPEKLMGAEWARLSSAIEKLNSCEMYIQDQAGLTVSDVRAQCVRFKAKNPNTKAIFIDQLSLFGRKGFNANTEYGNISGALKVLAKDLKIPIFLLAQLNTKTISARKIDDRRPMPSDLKDSMKPYEDADTAIFIHIPSQYDDRAPKIAEIILAKARNAIKSDVCYQGWEHGHFTEIEQHIAFNQIDQYEQSIKNATGTKKSGYGG